MSAVAKTRPAVRTTRIVCGNCLTVAPSMVVDLRAKLHGILKDQGWRLTTGEATCPTCCKVEDALAPRRAS